MEFADQGGLDQATSWVSGNAAATTADAPPANAAPGQQTQTQAPPAGGDPATPATPEDLTPYRELVDNLGGLDGARQFGQLYKAATTVSDDWSEIGNGINAALKELLKGDHYGALAMALYGEHGDLFMEQYLADHPEWLQAKLAELKPPAETLPPASGDDYDDYDDYSQSGAQPQMSARERELNDRLAKLEAELNGYKQSREQAAERQIRASVEKEVVGTIVDKTFAQLQGWEKSELERAYQIAMNDFANDPKAKEAFKGADAYIRTKQPLLAGHVVKAQQAFQQHLKNAIELIDLKRQAARKAAAPKEPERKEFGAGGEPPMDTRQPAQQTPRENFWNVNELLGAVNKRLAERGARV